MTGSKVLIVKLPELHADVKALEAFRAYVCDALGAGALVLPLGTTYAVEDFPALGAVEVVAGDAVPVVIGGPRPTPAGGGGGLVVGGRVVRSVPDSGTEKEPPKQELPGIPAAEGVSRPEPKPVEPPERPPEEKPDVPKPTEIKLPLAVGQATPRFAGKASSEKADIFARLNRYWSEKGPGSMIKLSEACGLDASKLYLMQRNDGKFDIEHWRAVNAGLDKLGYGGMK